MVASNRSKRYQDEDRYTIRKEIFKLNGNNLRTPLEIGENRTEIKKTIRDLNGPKEPTRPTIRKPSEIEVFSQRLNSRWTTTP